MGSDVHDRKTRSYNMSRIRGKDTKPELLMRSLLHREGFRFRVNYKKLPGKPDIVLPKYKTVVFVHGCFWHRHEGCRYTTTPATRRAFWEEKFAGTVRRDKEVQDLLVEMGWTVLIVWECELKQDAEEVLQKVSAQIKQETG